MTLSFITGMEIYKIYWLHCRYVGYSVRNVKVSVRLVRNINKKS